MKDILLIGDMTCFDNIALNCMIPILLSKKKTVSSLPTALVSNAFDYGKYSIIDTTTYMKDTTEVWEDLGFDFKLIFIGFVANLGQIDIIKNYISKRKSKIIIDPIMGDRGELYNGLDESYIKSYISLMGIADVILPNETEARLLTGMKDCDIEEVGERLIEMGAKAIVITSAQRDDDHFVYVIDKQRSEKISYDYVDAVYSGTGDLFSSIFVNEVSDGKDIFKAAKGASQTSTRLIKYLADLGSLKDGDNIPLNLIIDKI
ncbi:MAG: PfkB family carbohydrate kinase [Finegoldia sp.]|nr:PfkB family carbohydrate kinase [Finegoldia sp.]